MMENPKMPILLVVGGLKTGFASSLAISSGIKFI
jgi:hypothetical protein